MQSTTEDRGDFSQTYSGINFYHLDPSPEEVSLDDIAHALSNTCRFAGHVMEFYSVAEHSVLVSRNLPDHLRLQGLLHDATEAYVNDLPSPLKHSEPLRGYREIEEKVWKVIAKRFLLPAQLDAEVKRVDNAACCTEAMALLRFGFQWARDRPQLENGIIGPLPPAAAKRLFLKEFLTLWK